jgi:hypothetical protein
LTSLFIELINRPIFVTRGEDLKLSSCVNWLSAREKIGPVNEPLTSQSTCLFNRFAPLFGEVTIGRLTEQNPSGGMMSVMAMLQQQSDFSTD